MKMPDRRLITCGLLLCVGCAPSAAPEPVDVDALIASVRDATGEGELERDQLFRVPLGGSSAVATVLLSSSPSRRYVSVFESAAGPDPAGFHRVLQLDFERHGRWWMVPDAPVSGDLDGDGSHEVLITFSTQLADRGSRTAIVLTRRDQTWRALSHPSVIARVRSHFRAIGATASIFQDDELSRIHTADGEMVLQGLHSGGDWRLVRRPDGAASLLGTAIVTTDGVLSGPHRVAFTMFRLAGDEFVPDPDWNAARLHVTAEPRRLSEIDFERIVAEGFARRR